jgi:DNA primase
MGGPIQEGASLEAIRSQVDIVGFISEYVPLRKAGKNYRACCPFHAEKSPSFYVDPQKQFFYCFGCSQGGDVFRFVMLHENLSFPEAVNLIAERQGLQWKQTGKSRDARGVEETLQKIMDEALSFYRKSLHESREGKECRDYLEARGLTAETLETFDIGYASEEWERLLRHLTQAGFDPRAIEKSGLVIQRREGGGYYDRFRGRFMVPIRTWGNVSVSAAGCSRTGSRSI